jgi:apolipoprotein N-acyltransferase
MWFVGVPGIDVWPLAWAAMVPTFFAVERARTTRQAFLAAWLTGIIGNAGGFYWLVGMLQRFAHMPFVAAVPVFLLMCAYQGLVFALMGVAVRAVRRRAPRLPVALVAPLAMVGFELALPMVFPFNVAITQAWQRHVIQVADLAGPLGVTGLLLVVNGAVYDVATEGRRRARAALAAAGVLVGALAYGHVRIGQIERARAASPELAVGVVQPNLGFDQKGPERQRRAGRQLQDLQTQSARLEGLGAELILWPETGYPYAIPRDLEADLPATSRYRMRVGFSSPLLFGAVTRDAAREAPPPGVRRYPYNSALMMDRDGQIVGRFDKIFLMVGGEYTPGRDTFPFIARMMPETAGQYARGQRIVTLPLRTADGHEYRLGPMICFEDILPNFGRELAALHPHLLVNLTNDAWFGQTAEPWEHLGLSVFRAVEARVDLVRAVNTGVSAFVDATGHVYARTYAVDPAVDPRPTDGIVARVRLREGGHTVYAVVGDLFGYLCLAATAYLWLLAPWLARRRARRAGGATH